MLPATATAGFLRVVSYGVASEDVDTILADNGYEVVGEPREGDIVIYRDGLGHVQHTGLVRFVGTDGLVLVESKWGSLGIYLHTPKEQPYGEFFNFRRSSRPGHELHLKESTHQKPSPGPFNSAV